MVSRIGKNGARLMTPIRSVALVAHDQCKPSLIDWVRTHQKLLSRLDIYATGTTGRQLKEATALWITEMKSGPLGGDAQIGAMIAEGRLDALVFFIDPLSALPHDVDVKSLLRLATLHNTLLAVNEASATAMFAAAPTIEPTD